MVGMVTVTVTPTRGVNGFGDNNIIGNELSEKMTVTKTTRFHIHPYVSSPMQKRWLLLLNRKLQQGRGRNGVSKKLFFLYFNAVIPEFVSLLLSLFFSVTNKYAHSHK
jgi:hypothetical protein